MAHCENKCVFIYPPTHTQILTHIYTHRDAYVIGYLLLENTIAGTKSINTTKIGFLLLRALWFSSDDMMDYNTTE